MLIKKILLELLEKKLKKLNELRPLSNILLKKLKERFEVEMTYNSNAIEGNTLTLKETYWVIQEGITVKGKSLKEHLEVKNHKEALDYLYSLVGSPVGQSLSEHLIKQIHSLIIQNIDKKIAGQYRKNDVFITGTDHVPPSAIDVSYKMQELIIWMNENSKKMTIIEFSAIVHHKFVHIHPFEDGNGRTGRLLMNVFLMQFGFPIAIIQKNDRQKYYNSLSKADSGNYKPLVNLIAQAVLRSLNIYLNVLIPANEKKEYLLLSEISKNCPYSQEYLSKLAKEGKIDAYKEKRNWLTTKEAIENYIKKER